MSNYFQQNGECEKIEFGKSLTKQSFMDSCDINKMLAKAQKMGTLDHLMTHGAEYGEFANYDLQMHFEKLERAQNIFDELPSEMRNEFKNDPAAFFEFVNDPENEGRLKELLPAIAEPGSYFPDVSSKTPPGDLLEPKAKVVKETEPEGKEVPPATE